MGGGEGGQEGPGMARGGWQREGETGRGNLEECNGGGGDGEGSNRDGKRVAMGRGTK